MTDFATEPCDAQARAGDPPAVERHDAVLAATVERGGRLHTGERRSSGSRPRPRSRRAPEGADGQVLEREVPETAGGG